MFQGASTAYTDCRRYLSSEISLQSSSEVQGWFMCIQSRGIRNKKHEQEWEVLSPRGAGPTLIQTQHVILVQSCPISLPELQVFLVGLGEWTRMSPVKGWKRQKNARKSLAGLSYAVHTITEWTNLGRSLSYIQLLCSNYFPLLILWSPSNTSCCKRCAGPWPAVMLM